MVIHSSWSCAMYLIMFLFIHLCYECQFYLPDPNVTQYVHRSLSVSLALPMLFLLYVVFCFV